MNPLVYHIASGHAFFSGVALLLLAVGTSGAKRPRVRRVTVLCGVLGLMAIAISSTPLPYWFYAIAGLITMGWMASRWKPTWQRPIRWAMAIVWLVAIAIELPYHLTPTLHPVGSRAIAIIGDSVTAGVGSDETAETWPAVLAREHRLDVQDISHVGETAESATKRVAEHPISAPVVVVEIGGNDILGSTSPAKFATTLDALLASLAADDRQVMMLELPLPPFYHEYGRIQRQLAAKHQVKLVPKRVFLSILAGSDATLDTIHLSQAGHQRMAHCVWQLIAPAYPEP
ncbi:SGNH/GDSL hydrolase family protein [Aeoliella mucimassa]|uniref:Esterase TesA n=1 Tax=Aeoliella mucimassa TaxID=2527972 RepID=A0A518AI57_9BACT|nr:GDSL-type esterase/lipase family protein [Aeoliella mucimassa]QDU54410.1 Esterase TesA precursor [Aeoliella mucimassa]